MLSPPAPARYALHMRLLAASLVAGLAVASPTTAQQTVVDVQSLMTTPVWLYRGAQLVSQGTGFFYGNLRPDGTAEAIFLVTNYHVVTGHAPTVAASRSGDRIHFALHKDASDLEKFSEFELPLYDVHDEPVWASSDVYPNADVVLVPLPARMLPLYVFTEAHTRGTSRSVRPRARHCLDIPMGFSTGPTCCQSGRRVTWPASRMSTSRASRRFSWTSPPSPACRARRCSRWQRVSTSPKKV